MPHVVFGIRPLNISVFASYDIEECISAALGYVGYGENRREELKCVVYKNTRFPELNINIGFLSKVRSEYPLVTYLKWDRTLKDRYLTVTCPSMSNNFQWKVTDSVSTAIWVAESSLVCRIRVIPCTEFHGLLWLQMLPIPQIKVLDGFIL